MLQKTVIPVPKLFEYGNHPNGRQYLATEFIPGVLVSEFQQRACSMVPAQKLTDSTPCKMCLNQGYSNALQFIENVVFPELAKLTSQERGIDGFVIPSSWLSPDLDPL